MSKTGDTTRAWALAVREEYEQLREQHPAVAAMKRPVITLNGELRKTLGQWRQESRRLVLSLELFHNCNWDLVVAVLKHEVAHQLVSEYFHVHHEPPHGPTFERACQVLDIEPTTKAKLVPVSEGEDRLAARVHKLMALGESPNRHEAERALAKAHELMMKYNLSHLEDGKLGGYALRIVGPVYRRVPSYIWPIMRILGDFYFVEYICRPLQAFDTTRRGNVRVLEIYGTPANLDTAEYVFDFLLHQADIQWRRYKQENNLRTRRQRLSFLRGLYDGVYQSLERQRRHLEEEEALIWLGDPGLQDFYRKRNPQVRRTRSRTRHYQEAHQDGQDVGRQIRIRRGVGKENGDGIAGYLT